MHLRSENECGQTAGRPAGQLELLQKLQLVGVRSSCNGAEADRSAAAGTFVSDSGERQSVLQHRAAVINTKE